MEADLFCIHCKDEVPHKIIYINDKISHLECEVCSRVIDMSLDIQKEFYKEVYRRIASKPHRITQEYKDDLSHFLLSIPKRAITKPYRLLKDIKEIREIKKEKELQLHVYDKKEQ